MPIEHNSAPLDDDPEFEEPRKKGAFPSVKVTMTRAQIIEQLKKHKKVYILWGVAIVLVAVMAGCAVIGAARATANAGQKMPAVSNQDSAEQQQAQEQEWQRREQMMAAQATRNTQAAANTSSANGQQFSPEMRQRILDCENGAGSCAGVPQAYWPQYGENAGPQGGMSQEQQAAQTARQQREEFAWKARFAGPNDGPIPAEKKAQAAIAPVSDAHDASTPKADNDSAETLPKADDDTGEEKKAPYSQATGHEYRLMGGITQIPARIENGITAELGGSVLAFTTDDVWSWNHQTVVIPKGSFLTGKYRKVGSNSEERVDVLLDSLVMPDGYRVNFGDAEGLDIKGETGLRDMVNHHYIQVFATSIGIASVGGIAQLGNNTAGYTYTPTEVMRQGFAGGMGQAGEQALNRYSNRPPTLTIRPGTVLNLYFPHDMLLPAYSAHTMDPNL